jgi:glycosyltransferase involved in cell wall biosynthesis
VSDVVHFVHAFNGRAIASVAACIADQMQARGLQIVIVASTVLPGAPEVDVEVVDLGGSGRRTLPTIPALRRELRRRQPGTVFAHAEGPLRAAVLATQGQRSRPQLVGVVHNHYSSYPWRAPAIRRRLDALAFGQADGVLAVSPGVADDLEVTFPRLAGRTEVVPPPLTRWATLGAPEALPPDDPWFDGERPTIVAVGHVHPRKDHGTLVRALAELRDRGRPLPRVAIIGNDEGAHAQAVRGLVTELGLGDHVRLLGERPDPLPYVAAADVLALSSTNEGFGLVLIEAMAVGTPVVSTDAPAGPRWVLDDGAAGLLTPVGDPTALADAIGQVIDDPELRQRLVTAGRARATAFVPAVVAEQYLAAAGLTSR